MKTENPLINYKDYNTKILHKCITCKHEWRVTPAHIMRKRGCPECYRIKRSKTTSAYNKEIREKIINIMNLGEYVNAITKILHLCNACGYEWLANPNSILSGRGCIKCKKQGYSKIAIEWLNGINTEIQHALNGGEYIIPTTKYKVDGYHEYTNTVYEFLGIVGTEIHLYIRGMSNQTHFQIKQQTNYTNLLCQD